MYMYILMVIKQCSPFLSAQNVKESFDLVTALVGIIAYYVYPLYYMEETFASSSPLDTLTFL